MTIPQTCPQFGQVALSPTPVVSDLDDPTCERHWRPAVGYVDQPTPDDHERRRFFCRECAWDVQSEAMRAGVFPPPVAVALDLDMDRPWAVAA